MRTIFISVVILFLLAACAAQPTPQVTVTPASRVTVTLTPTATVTTIPTASVTPTPAETTLTAETMVAGTSIGKWSFVENANGNLELMVNGAGMGVEAWTDKLGVNITYNGETYAIAAQDVLLKPDGTGRIGRFEVNKNFELIPIPGNTAVEWLEGKGCGPEVTILVGGENEDRLVQSALKMNALLIGEEVAEMVDNAVAKLFHMIRLGRNYHKEGLFDLDPRTGSSEVVSRESLPKVPLLDEKACLILNFTDGEKEFKAVSIPVGLKTPEEVVPLSVWLPLDQAGRLPEFVSGRDGWADLNTWLVTGVNTQKDLAKYIISNNDVLAVVARNNSKHLLDDKISVEGSMDKSWSVNFNDYPEGAKESVLTFVVPG